KFRWIIYDTDLGWGNYKSTLLDDFTSPIKTKWYNPTWSTYLLRNLLKNKTFERDFINQSAYLLSSLLNTENVQNKISEFEEMYKQEMVYHFENRKKFQSYQGDLKKWQKEVNQLKFFALKRDNALLSQIQKKFHFSDPYNLNISIENLENGKVLLNNNELINATFSGTFFSELDLPISIVPNVGYSFSGYNKSIIENKNGENISIHIVFIQNQKSDKKVVINEIDYKNDCIEIFN
ncbi:MAG: CotH kinase family protein, partial [Fidelibacterota bacterium]